MKFRLKFSSGSLEESRTKKIIKKDEGSEKRGSPLKFKKGKKRKSTETD